MYHQIKSKINFNGQFSDTFRCENGVRQGENLSPFLFSIYLNDLNDFFLQSDINGLETITQQLDEKLDCYLKLFVILYADDTVLLAESSNDLQNQLDIFENYCKKWNLRVNVGKTKILIFGRGNSNMNNTFFKFGQNSIEITNEFNYLGTIFQKKQEISKRQKYSRQKRQLKLCLVF